jgi:hypothetical protein
MGSLPSSIQRHWIVALSVTLVVATLVAALAAYSAWRFDPPARPFLYTTFVGSHWVATPWGDDYGNIGFFDEDLNLVFILTRTPREARSGNELFVEGNGARLLPNTPYEVSVRQERDSAIVIDGRTMTRQRFSLTPGSVSYVMSDDSSGPARRHSRGFVEALASRLPIKEGNELRTICGLDE